MKKKKNCSILGGTAQHDPYEAAMAVGDRWKSHEYGSEPVATFTAQARIEQQSWHGVVVLWATWSHIRHSDADPGLNISL